MSELPRISIKQWYLPICLGLGVVLLGLGYVYGLVAVHDANYLNHLLVLAFAAFLVYWVLKLPPDGDPVFAVIVAVGATVILLGVGHAVAISEYHRNFPGSTLEVISAHVSEGVVYRDREYGRFGAHVDRIRSGGWVYLCWFIQAITTPIVLFMTALSASFRAHVRTHNDEDRYTTALDYVVEQNFLARKFWRWQPLQAAIRPIDLRRLVVDLVYSYGVFVKPLLIVGVVAIIWPDTQMSYPLVMFWASLFMLHGANAVLTGSHDTMRMSIGTAFEQFMISVRLVAFLFIAFIFAFFAALMLGGLLSMIKLVNDHTDIWNLYIVVLIAMMVTILVRLWPMLVIHYLYDDVVDDGMDRAQIARSALKSSLWFGAPGQSLTMAWQLTSLPGALIRATAPAILVPLGLIGVWSELQVRSDGVVEWLMTAGFFVLLLPYVYLILMDRALALRETYMERPAEEGDELSETVTPDGHGIDGDSRLLTDSEEDFLEAMPVAAIKGGDSLAEFARDRLDDSIRAQTEGQPWQLLNEAIRMNNDAWFEDALNQGADFNQRADDGLCALHRACRMARHAMVERLLRQGGSVHSKSEGGDLPLHFAIEGSDDDDPVIPQMLLNYGAEVDARGHLNRTPFDVALEMDKPRLARMLLDRGAALGRDDELGDRIVLTANRHALDSLRMLLTLPGRNIQQIVNRPPVAVAVARQWDSLMIVVEAGLDPNLILENGDRLLHRVAAELRVDSVVALIAVGADPGLPDASGRLPIHCAVDWDGKQAQAVADIQKALSDGHKVDSPTNSNEPEPLPGKNADLIMIAARAGTLVELRYRMQQAGVNLESQINRFVLLQQATPAALELLLQAGADPNLESAPGSGFTLLHWAVGTAQPDKVAVLLSNGADAARKDHNGDRPIDMAVSWGTSDVENMARCRRLLEATYATTNRDQ